MALGETQIVMETREFLVKNGVILDQFSKVNSAVTFICANWYIVFILFYFVILSQMQREVKRRF